MEFTCEHVFDAPVDRLMAMYADPDYIPTKYRELGLRDIEVVSRRHDAHGFELCCRFRQRASIEVPKLAQKFVGGAEWMLAEQTDRWDFASRTGRLDVVIEPFKAFAKIHCLMTVEAHPRGAVNRMRWTVECAVPLIGGTLAKFIAQDIERKSALDGDMARQLLARRP